LYDIKIEYYRTYIRTEAKKPKKKIKYIKPLENFKDTEREDCDITKLKALDKEQLTFTISQTLPGINK
jgi:hypothetical protein